MSQDGPSVPGRLGSRGRPTTVLLWCPEGRERLRTAVKKVSWTIGGIPVVVHYASAALGQVVGLMYVNMEVPNDIQPGDHVPVAVQMGPS